MIVVTYLFSQGIANAGMIERLIEPVLIKVVHTPVQCIIAIFVTMLIHMILGSNTTTLSVVVPGLMILCSSAIEPQLIVFITIISVSFHTILPFHSVPMMIGTSNDYFPASYVTKMGIPLTIFVYGVILLVYLPYWTMMGLL